MKKFILFIILILSSSIIIHSQTRGRPDPTPITPTQKAINRSNDVNRRSNELRNVENFPVRNNEEGRTFRKAIKPLYRKATKSELKLLVPDKEFLTTYESFLKKKKTGLIKLTKDHGCADTVNLINASKTCATYTMPGAGSSYSFRTKSYRLKNLGDLNFTGKSFHALGVLLHGVMVNLGDVRLEQVDSKTNGYKYVRDFEAAKNFKKAAEFATKLQKGIKANGFTYASVLPAKVNSTYILRSIAYKGISPRTIEGITYNELDFDKRKDVTIAFRVLQKSDESITLLWKEMESKKSPKLVVSK